MDRKTVYYTDELNDEFAGDNIKTKTIDGNYKYISHSLWYKVCHFFCYKMVAIPFAYFYLKLKFHHKVINKQILKPYKKQGYFIYGNHTQNVADAFIPTMATLDTDVYVLVHPNNVSMPVLGKINHYLGALPLPDDFEASKNFVKAIETRINEHCIINVYPEAHIWPYYNKIRPFSDKSFRYPINTGKPTFCFVNVYKKHKNKVRIETHFDGPFFPNNELSPKDKKADLRNRVYQAMVKLSELSDIEYIKYVKKEEPKVD